MDLYSLPWLEQCEVSDMESQGRKLKAENERLRADLARLREAVGEMCANHCEEGVTGRGKPCSIPDCPLKPWRPKEGE